MTRLEEDLKKLRERLSEMAMLVKSQLKKSICSLLEEDEDLANEVIVNEKRVNAMELNIDRDCELILALLNPVAHDMRFVFSTLKINADLERIADYGEDIARIVLIGEKSFDKDLIKTIRLTEMSEITQEMMEDVTKAYFEDNTKIARSVFSKDLKLDEINKNASTIAENYIKNNLDKIQQALMIISIIRKLERVGDHITNIAEEVIFYKEAKVLRHVDKSEDTEKEV
ncbi:MAG TPA: phosphate signaling complex protein PhoU [Chitinophagaceae bacterium]|nr:phosphate signaling complex protein PhoU [Chitinophagaceae bacterium]